MAHTPGPWFAEKYEGVIGDVSDSNGDSVAQAQARQPLAAGKSDEERKANARLIAASPDLLQACIQALDFIQYAEKDLGRNIMTGNDLRSAISKAKGE